MIINSLRRLSLNTKIMLSALFSLVVVLIFYILSNIVIFGLLQVESNNYIINQFFSTLEILIIIALSLFIVSGFHFILTQIFNLPYSDYKLEITTSIFFILNLLLFVPTTFTSTQFQLSPSIKLLLDTIYMVTGSIYLVLATGVFYIDLEGIKALSKRYTRWSVLVFLIFFYVIALETVRQSMAFNVLLTFTGINLLLILAIVFNDIQTLLVSNSKSFAKQAYATEIIVFLLFTVTILIGKTLHLIFVLKIFG